MEMETLQKNYTLFEKKKFLILNMNKKKSIQIFYGGFKFVKGGVNSHSISLKEELKENFDVNKTVNKIFYHFKK